MMGIRSLSFLQCFRSEAALAKANAAAGVGAVAAGVVVAGGAGVDSARLNELEGLLETRSKELVEMGDKLAVLEKKVTQVGKEKEMIEKKMQRIEKAKEQEVAELKDKLEASQGDVRVQLKVRETEREGYRWMH